MWPSIHPLLLLALAMAGAGCGRGPKPEFDFTTMTPGRSGGTRVGERIAYYDVRVEETIDHVLLIDSERVSGGSMSLGSGGAFVSKQPVLLRSGSWVGYVSAPGAVLLNEVRYDLADGRVLCLAERDGAPHVTQLAIDLEPFGNGDLESTDDANDLCRRLFELPQVVAALASD